MDATRRIELGFLALVVSLAFAATSQADLIWYSPLDGNANATVGPNPISQTNVTATTDRDGNPNAALLFNGTNSNILIDKTLCPSFTEGTISAWYQRDTASAIDRGIACVGGHGSGPEEYIGVLSRASGGAIRADVDDGVTRREVLSSNSDTTSWHHVAASFQTGGQMALYIDGAQVGSGTSQPGGVWSIDPQNNWCIGSYDTNNYYWNGSIDDVAIFSNQLTTAQIAQLAAGTAPTALVGPQDPQPFARIDFGPAGQRIEPGFTGVGVAANNANGAALAETLLTSLTGESFSVAISAVDWRDRGNTTSGQYLALLGEDFVKSNAGDITVTLTGLPEGEYEITSYHIDPTNSQCADIEIYLTDALGVDVLQQAMGDASALLGGVNNLTTAAMENSSATFLVQSNGIDSILIRFNGIGSDTETPLNGLLINLIPPKIPEPATLSLLGFGALALARRRRTSRRISG